MNSKASFVQLIGIANQHALAEGGVDLEAIMATLEGEPVYEYYPVGRRLSGITNTRRLYENFLQDVQPRMLGFKLISESVGPSGVVQEFNISLLALGNAEPSVHRIMAILTFGENGLSGERMYSDETLLRTLVGPLWDQMEPIELSL